MVDLKKSMRSLARRIVGYDDQIDTLHYFLNAFADVRDAPKASGALRKLQLCDLELLKIFDATCRANGWGYILAAGTLLGAYRHGGFIPWDDDLDVVMLREDYEKARLLMPGFLADYGIDAREEIDEPLLRIGVGYKHADTGIWLDVFPADVVWADSPRESSEQTLTEQVASYRASYQRHRKKWSRSKLAECKNARKPFVSGGFEYWCIAPEFGGVFSKCSEKSPEPLSEIEFEGFRFPAPGDIEGWLANWYGPEYMGFPLSGVEHHGGDKGRLKTWASSSGTDMDSMLEELKLIYAEIASNQV